MPKASVTDPITDQEIAFAHLVLSGTMNDRQAAEAAGINPTTAAYTKSKPRVRDYMDKHRAAVSEKLTNLEADGLHRLNLGREQILARLWQLANLSPEETKGSIAGQIKAMSMIATIEGLLQNRSSERGKASALRETASLDNKPDIYVSEWMRQRQHSPVEPAESVTATQVEPPPNPTVPQPPHAPAQELPSPDKHQQHNSADSPPAFPNGLSWVPNAIGLNLGAYSNSASPLRLPLAPGKRRFGRGR